MPHKPSIAIIGGGPAAMMLACSIDTGKYRVSLYEKNGALGRKFLVAGKGGFNVTHSEEQRQFADRYHPKTFIRPFLEAFSNHDLRQWLQTIGIDTYVGTSKRVFPVKGIKPIEVLKAIEQKLLANDVAIHYHHEWKGWKNEQLCFVHKDQEIGVAADITVFALGGASWKVTGSDGSWINYFKEKNISVLPFQASNCACEVQWEKTFIDHYEGQALKNCLFSCDTLSKKGEAVITRFGIEGSGLYPLSPAIRQQLNTEQKAIVHIDLKPDLEREEILGRLENRGHASVKDVLEKKLHLGPLQVELLKLTTTKESYHNAASLTDQIKAFPLSISGLAPMDDAISTVGGIATEELNETLELKKLPGYYCIGEMIDWDAPTGGYLLQACFSMGYTLAKHINSRRIL